MMAGIIARKSPDGLIPDRWSLRVKRQGRVSGGKAFYKALRSRFRVSYDGVSAGARGLRRFGVIRRSSGFYRPLRFVLAPARAGDSRLEDKVLREFSGLTPFGERGSQAERHGADERRARYQPINIYQD